MRALRMLTVVCLLVLLPVAALGQAGNGQIRGLCRDPEGAAIPGANITIKQIETGVERPEHSSFQEIHDHLAGRRGLDLPWTDWIRRIHDDDRKTGQVVGLLLFWDFGQKFVAVSGEQQ